MIRNLLVFIVIIVVYYSSRRCSARRSRRTMRSNARQLKGEEMVLDPECHTYVIRDAP
jgi:hypothetical protein